MIKKSVISLIAYDAHYLPDSIRSYYPYVEEIVLGIDEKRLSWSNIPFTFDENKLWKELQAIDVDNKITIIEDNFHKSKVALENDNYERNMLKSQCSNDWIFSFDADETLINPKPFFYEYLPYIEPYYNKVDLRFTWFLPYKEVSVDHAQQIAQIETQKEDLIRTSGGTVDSEDFKKIMQNMNNDIERLKNDSIYLVIANDDNSFFKGDTQGFATWSGHQYTFCRWTNNQRHILSNLGILHWSFCRKPGEVDQKINNFGHSDKTPNDPFFNVWQQVNIHNYVNLRNFKSSGFGEAQWNKLIPVPKHELIPRLEAEAARIL